MYATTGIREIEPSKLVYFMASILWRGSVHKWKWGRDEFEAPTLGKRYEEEFRRYLLGETDLPRNAAVHVFLMSKKDLWNGFANPICERLRDGTWRYAFTLLGISFRCYLGNTMDAATRSGCVYRSHKQFVFIGQQVDEKFIRDFGPILMKSKQLGSIKQ
jgi:hypothetical protein